LCVRIPGDSATGRRRVLDEKIISIPDKRSRMSRADMNLNDDQQKAVSAWVANGAKLSEVQTRLAEEFGIRLTYMEVRFLVDDLKLRLKDADPTPPAAAAALTGSAAAMKTTPLTPGEAKAFAADHPLPGGGKVAVTVDRIARPGALVSGGVTFSDGVKAEWHLDQTGRLGLVPPQAGYKPTPTDIESFQLALEQEMAKLGY